MRARLLAKRRLLEIGLDSGNSAFLVAKLINQFGVVVDKPEMVNEGNVRTIAQFYGAKIPNGFYNNPQDLQYFTVEELYLEQLVSYIKIAISGEYALDEKVFERVELFSRVLPNYKQGDELKLRKYSLITKAEADDFLRELGSNFSKYTRPWSTDELAEFKWLYSNGYYDNQPLMCKDNAIQMFLTYKTDVFAKMLDLKDIVKMSLSKYGRVKQLNLTDEDRILFPIAIKNAKQCPLSIAKAKYFNSLTKNLGMDYKKVDNSASPYKKALELLKNNDVVGSAKEFAKSGALLERNLVFLLSRANLEEASQILDLLKADNPIVLMQLLIGIINEDYSNGRTFTFYNYKNNLQSHTETEKEHKYRKSILSIGMKKYLVEQINQRITEYYLRKESLGKIFIDEKFKKIGIPFNTSAMGTGLDVLPSGSRVDITADNVRAFCYWDKLFDVDMSVAFTHKNGEMHTLYWGNYSKKEFGKSALSSGDNRSSKGAEFNDFRITELKNLGYTNAVVVLNGYGEKLNIGEIYCGYQNKNNLETKAWDPKNIELKIHVKGDTYTYVAFAIDFETNEIVILNQKIESDNRVIDVDDMRGITQYLNKEYLNTFNMFKILTNLGEVVENPESADVVFMDDYDAKESQKVVKTYDIEKLVELLK